MSAWLPALDLHTVGSGTVDHAVACNPPPCLDFSHTNAGFGLRPTRLHLPRHVPVQPAVPPTLAVTGSEVDGHRRVRAHSDEDRRREHCSAATLVCLGMILPWSAFRARFGGYCRSCAFGERCKCTEGASHGIGFHTICEPLYCSISPNIRFSEITTVRLFSRFSPLCFPRSPATA
jgi:hypothetical protein